MKTKMILLFVLMNISIKYLYSQELRFSADELIENTITIQKTVIIDYDVDLLALTSSINDKGIVNGFYMRNENKWILIGQSKKGYSAQNVIDYGSATNGNPLFKNINKKFKNTNREKSLIVLRYSDMPYSSDPELFEFQILDCVEKKIIQ